MRCGVVRWPPFPPYLAERRLQDLGALAELRPAVVPHGLGLPEGAGLVLGVLAGLRQKRPGGRPVCY